MHWWYEREPQAGSGQPEASAARSRPSLQLLPSSSSTAGGGSLGGGGRRLHGGARPRRAGEEGAAGAGVRHGWRGGSWEGGADEGGPARLLPSRAEREQGPRPPRVPGPARHGWRERREQGRCCPVHERD